MFVDCICVYFDNQCVWRECLKANAGIYIYACIHVQNVYEYCIETQLLNLGWSW